MATFFYLRHSLLLSNLDVQCFRLIQTQTFWLVLGVQICESHQLRQTNNIHHKKERPTENMDSKTMSPKQRKASQVFTPK